jgi:hypothetical protein
LTYRANCKHIEILTKRELPNDLGSHQRPPFVQVSISTFCFLLDFRNRIPRLLSNEAFPILAQRRFAEWTSERFASLRVDSRVNSVEDIDPSGSEARVPRTLEKAAAYLVDLVESLHGRDIDFTRRDSDDWAILLVQVVDVV